MFAVLTCKALAVVLVGIYFASVAAAIALVQQQQPRKDANDKQ